MALCASVILAIVHRRDETSDDVIDDAMRSCFGRGWAKTRSILEVEFNGGHPIAIVSVQRDKTIAELDEKIKKTTEKLKDMIFPTSTTIEAEHIESWKEAKLDHMLDLPRKTVFTKYNPLMYKEMK
jgi:hypothetical protein